MSFKIEKTHLIIFNYLYRQPDILKKILLFLANFNLKLSYSDHQTVRHRPRVWNFIDSYRRTCFHGFELPIDWLTVYFYWCSEI